MTNSSISDADKDKLQASSAASGVSVDKWLEVDLQQIVNKGKENEYWTEDKEELSAKITITLYVGTGLSTVKEYVVVREHKGVYEQIPATYNPVEGTLTFQSDKFSEYAVGTVVSADNVLGTINSNWTGNGSVAGSTVTTLKSTFTGQEIASAVQAANGSVNMTLLDKLKALEDDYKDEKQIAVDQEAAIQQEVAGSVSGPVTVIGAAFNVADYSSVQLVIGGKTGDGITVGNSYSKSVQLDISLMETASGLSNAAAVMGNLSMPVTITMPVPTGIDASRLVILHENGSGVETVPYSLSGGNVIFTVTHFSNFAFAEKVVSAGEGGNAGSSDDNDSSFTSATEEKVSVPVEYTVVKGDTLGKIARKNNLTLSELLALNPQIKNPNRIYPGQKIIVGYIGKTVTSSATSTTNSDAVFYVVQKGDFLYRIARNNGLSLTQLGVLNPGVLNQRYIYPGQKIRVK